MTFEQLSERDWDVRSSSLQRSVIPRSAECRSAVWLLASSDSLEWFPNDNPFRQRWLLFFVGLPCYMLTPRDKRNFLLVKHWSCTRIKAINYIRPMFTLALIISITAVRSNSGNILTLLIIHPIVSTLKGLLLQFMWVKWLCTWADQKVPPSGCFLEQFRGISRPAGKRRQMCHQLWGSPAEGASKI